MKAKIISTFLGVFVISIALAQNLQKQYYTNNQKYSGDVVVKSSEIKLGKNDDVEKVFEIESPSEGTFYLNAFLSAPLTPKGYPEYNIAVNNIISSATLKPQTSSWQNVVLSNSDKSTATVKLKKGINYISVIGQRPAVPSVELIKLSSSPIDMGISDSKYKAYIEGIKTNTLDLNSNILQDEISNISPIASTNNEIYAYQLNVPINYTTARAFVFQPNTPVSIKTTQNSNFEYVIYFFSMSDTNYSWSKYCKGNGTLEVVAPVQGFYTLYVSAYRPMTTGIADIQVNNTYLNESPIGGNQVAISGTYSTNYITCTKNSNFTWLYLKDNSTDQGKIRAFSLAEWNWDDYVGGTKTISNRTDIRTALISSGLPTDPIFNADVYLGLKTIQAAELSNFPNLSADWSFHSGPSTGIYNCISWTVGVTNDWIWLGGYSLANYDALYNSYGYTRTGANAENAAIALWALDGAFTHGSVRKNSKIPNPHGFSWESKLGATPRVMHRKNAVGGSLYGQIVHYYRPTSGSVGYSSVSSNYTKSTFSVNELSTIESLKIDIPTHVKSEFNAKYTAWKETWNNPDIAIFSDPRKFAESKEYSELLQYCLKYGKTSWPLFIDKLSDGDVFVCNLLEDLTSPKKENKVLYDEAVRVKARSIGIPSPFIYSNMVEYSKRLLKQENLIIKNEIKNIIENEMKDPDINISSDNSNILINVNSNKVAPINVIIYDIYGTSVYSANYNIPVGGWKTAVNASTLRKGTYVVQIVINGKTISQKINL